MEASNTPHLTQGVLVACPTIALHSGQYLVPGRLVMCSIGETPGHDCGYCWWVSLGSDCAGQGQEQVWGGMSHRDLLVTQAPTLTHRHKGLPVLF